MRAGELEELLGDTGFDPREQTPRSAPLPLTDATRHLFPSGQLSRGKVLGISGSCGVTSLVLALLAGPARSGAWTGILDMESIGWAAAEEAGLPLGRTVLVRTVAVRPGPDSRAADSRAAVDRAAVMAAMVDAFDVVVLPAALLGAAQLRRLRSRARERGSLLVGFGSGLAEADARIEVLGTRWEGLGRGWGRLGARSVTVEVRGRGALDRPSRLEVGFDSRGSLRPPVPDEVERSGATGHRTLHQLVS